MTANTVEIMDKGMRCLTEGMGIVEAEQFISIIIREKFDYTEWQQKFYDKFPVGEVHKQAIEYAKTHPYTGKAVQI